MRVPLERLLAGPFHFLQPSTDELRSLVPEATLVLPHPQRIFLDDEGSTPLHGFPVLLTPGLRELERSAENFVDAEEALQLAVLRRQTADGRSHSAAWEEYRRLFRRALENVVASSYGRQQAGVFCLYHSLSVARIVRDAPRRLARQDPGLGRSAVETIRFRALERLLERQAIEAYEVAQRVAADQQRAEEDLYPSLLTLLRDNVLIMSETHVSASLEELSGYFSACLSVDGKDFARRLEGAIQWHDNEFPKRAHLRATAEWVGWSGGAPRGLFKRPGYARWLAEVTSPADRETWAGPWIEVWERLLLKLKEFELLNGLRRLIVPVERSEEGFIGVGRRHPSGTGQPLRLSSSTRPLDFLSTWVVSPEVERSGLVYDISQFSEILSRLGWSGASVQDESSRAFFRFQRRVGQIAASYGLMLEKYLGDGAFFSSRRAQPVLLAAVKVQRAYADAVGAGLPFDRGLRMALGFGSYRLLPVEDRDGGPDRYEFYGQGLVELTRLTSGKAVREIEEIKHLLLTLGYPEGAVNRFFAPVLESNVDLVDRGQEARRFYAYLNRNGSLINEGIVVTARFVQRLESEWQPDRFELLDFEDRSYAVVAHEESGSVTRIGLRRLGVANLKGLERLVVCEVIDASAPHWVPTPVQAPAGLTALLEELAARDLARRPPVDI